MVVANDSLSRVVDILSDAPSAERILAIRSTDQEEARLDYLTERLKLGKLSEEERVEIDRYHMAEHLVRMAKMKAHARLRNAS